MWHFHSVLQLTHKSHWPAFEQGKAANGPPCWLDGTQGTHPSMASSAATLAQQHRGMKGDVGVLGCQSPDTWAQTGKQKSIFTLSCLILSSHLLVCLPGRQALSISEYFSYTWIHTHMLRDRHVLCVSDFFVTSFLSQSFLRLCCIVCGCMATLVMMMSTQIAHNDYW